MTDITYICTYEGWLYLAAVMDLYSRQIIGWATRSTMTSSVVLQALLAAVWKRKPGPGVMVHLDQNSQFANDDWKSFLQVHHMVCEMSGRGKCHDNAVAESFVSAVKNERINPRI
ncbi:transposase InsO family protein [Paraburkholderia caledonica]|uniref:Transposase InsO family protein n=1 Tax=Paraburkholderia caledonica TaxID=134536 RepID=A0AB73INK9_9BURK|nr:transposase InsO family protein [Paraburkholderia caledonica]